MVYVRSHCDWPSDDEEGVGCSNWDSEGVGSCYSQHYKLERDDSKDAEKCWEDDMDDEQGASECWDCPGNYVSQKNAEGLEDLMPSGTSDACQDVGSKTDEEYRSWMHWRDRPTNDDDGVGDGDKEEDLLDQKDYTW